MTVPGLLTIARKLNNFDANATAGGLWTDTTHYRVTVPTGKRWFILGGLIKRDVSSTIDTVLYDASDDVLGYLLSEAAATTTVMFPESDFFIGAMWILDAGEYIESTFGTAQGAGAYHSCVVLEVDA